MLACSLDLAQRNADAYSTQNVHTAAAVAPKPAETKICD